MLPQKLSSQKEHSNTSLSIDSMIGISFKESPRVASNCSCFQCNSIDCFEIRNLNSYLPCTCVKCNKDKVCTYYSNNLPNNKPDSIKSCVEVTRENIVEHEQKDSIKQHTKSKDAELDVSETAKYNIKDILLVTDKINLDQEKFNYEKSVKRNYSVTINYSRKEEKKEYGNSTAKLSAEIMNLPYSEFKGSLSANRIPSSFDQSNLTKLDILTKLKEIYKACSCKVCECITGKSCLTPGHGTKETYNCVDSNSYKLENHEQPKQIPHPGCPCYSCDRKDCKGVVKETVQPTNCDCEPCDCVKYSKSVTKPCECQPCQCTECTPSTFRAPRSIIVAPVQGNFQQNLCQCEPCDCVNCTQNYGTMASSLMHEASTGMVTHRNCHCETCVNSACQLEDADCRCDTQNKIMRKPIDRHNRDYDLRRALVGDKSFSKMRLKKNTNHDMIAMFTLSNFFSNTAFNISNDRCQCRVCECVVCKDMERYGEKHNHSFKYFNKYSNLSSNPVSTCKCRSCECQICVKDGTAQNCILKKKCVQNKYDCDNCDCITCEGHSSRNSAPYIHLNKKTNETKSYVFEDICNDVSKDTREIVYPLKKGKPLTPSMFKDHSIKLQLESSLHNLKNEKPCVSILKENTRKCKNNMISSRSQPFYRNQNLGKRHLACFNDPCSNNVIENFVGNLRDTINSKIFSSKRTDTKKCIETRRHSCVNAQKSMSDKTSKTSETNVDKVEINLHTSNNQPLIYIDKSAEGNKIDLIDINLNSSISQKSFRNSCKWSNNGEYFCAKIESFEKSITQLQEDITRHLKTLEEIRLQDIIPKDKEPLTKYKSEDYLKKKISGIKIFEKVVSDDTLVCMNKNTLEIATPIRTVAFSEELDQTAMPFKEQKPLILNTKENLIGNQEITDNDGIQEKSIYNSDNKIYKMYSKLIKRSHNNIRINNIKKKVRRSSIIKQLSYEKNDVKKGRKIERDRYYKNDLGLSSSIHCSKSTSVTFEEIDFSELGKIDNRNKDVNEGTADLQKNRGSYDDNKQWSILRKNIYLNNLLTRKNEGVCTIPLLQYNIKSAVKSISSQTIETEGYTALTNLQLEVKELLNSPLLQVSPFDIFKSNVADYKNFNPRPKNKLDSELKYVRNDNSSQTRKKTITVDKEMYFNFEQSMQVLNQNMQHLVDVLITRSVCKSELTKPNSQDFRTEEETPRIPRINCVKSSCDGLKVSFMGLRKVSDHSVLVRWKMPRDINEVQGYEVKSIKPGSPGLYRCKACVNHLQVDGRAVQKILSPSRCMAVLTCLPHCEKLLLTIRTLTATARLSHHPTATIVYCPRQKLTHSTQRTYFADH